MYRELRPVPSADGQELARQTKAQQRVKNRTSLACQPCRDKRRKCSGQRPECRECTKRAVICVYDAAPGQTRMGNMKELNDRMKTDLDVMMELYWYLQTEPKEEVGEALSAIQTGASPSQVMEAIQNRTGSIDATPSSDRISESSTWSVSRPALDRDSSSSSGQSLEVRVPSLSHGTQTPAETSAFQSPVSETAGQPSLLKFLDALEKGAQAFFSCTGSIFHIYDREEAEKMIHDLRLHLEEGGKSWMEIVFQGSIPSRLKPSLCSLCIMAAIGLQYIKTPIPALGFPSSGSDGSYEFVRVFYEATRHLFEAVIETDVLEAMKVCAALTVFNTIGHATIAMAYVDMGINFVLSLGPSQQHPHSVSGNSWIKYKRVARTLVTLRSWLVSTLGYVHKENAGLQTGMHWLADIQDLTPQETIQQELHKIVHIEANLLRAVDSFRDLYISPALLSSTRRDLEQWHHELPAWMHLKALLEPSGNEIILRRTVFLVHLFYLSASMLLARLAHGARKFPTTEGTEAVPRYDIHEVRIAVGDGVQAARTAARILQLQMDEQAVYQRCWNCEFSAYMSSLLLLHSTAQMLLHNYPQPTWQNELLLAQSCLSVLEHCAEADKVAARFAEITRSYYSTLAAQIQPDDDIHVYDTPHNFDYLFSVPASSDPQLAQASCDLLKRISCPFDSPSSLHDEGTLKIGLGAHITMAFNQSPLRDSDSRSSATSTILSGMPTGQFMGSAQPHGWDVLLNLDAM